jgi:hypothetical protein
MPDLTALSVCAMRSISSLFQEKLDYRTVKSRLVQGFFTEFFIRGISCGKLCIRFMLFGDSFTSINDLPKPKQYLWGAGVPAKP